MTSTDVLAPLRRIAELQSRGDALLVKTAVRRRYDELRAAVDLAAELGDQSDRAAAERELAKEFKDDVPPKVTGEELLDYHREKRGILRELVDQYGAEEFGEALDEAESQYAEAFRQAPPAITYVSFGYLHGPEPEDADVIYNMRPFKDPHLNPGLRELTADHELVMRAVFDTPGVRELGLAILATVEAYRANPLAGPIRIAVGCAGGRHRSAAMVRWLQMQHHGDELKVVTEDRDIHRDVVDR